MGKLSGSKQFSESKRISNNMMLQCQFDWSLDPSQRRACAAVSFQQRLSPCLPVPLDPSNCPLPAIYVSTHNLVMGFEQISGIYSILCGFYSLDPSHLRNYNFTFIPPHQYYAFVNNFFTEDSSCKDQSASAHANFAHEAVPFTFWTIFPLLSEQYFLETKTSFQLIWSYSDNGVFLPKFN